LKQSESGLRKMIDRTRAGTRVKLIYCSDPYTQLQSGDLGTIKYDRFDDVFGDDTTSIAWDSGSSLTMISGKDQYEIVKE